MRILRIIASMDPINGGPCQGIRNSIPAQKSLGVENEVVCFDAPDSEYLKNDNIKIHAIGPSIGPYAYCPGFQSWLKVNLLNFDIIIIHGVWLYNSFGSFYFWKQLKKQKFKVPKVYLMPHGMLDPYFQKTKERRLKAIRNFFFWHIIEKNVINGIDGLLFTCEEELLLARKNFGFYRPKSEKNIGYGIQIPPVYSRKLIYNFTKNCIDSIKTPYFLFLSRIHPKKGVEMLINGYLQFKKHHKDFPDLVIAGPGLDSPYGKEMQLIAKESTIHFPGMLEGDAKWGAFFGCEAFILPSHQENFGIAVVEAMACAKPVLISSQINIWREIISGGGGIVEEDTEIGVYNLFDRWWKKSEGDRKEMGIKALEIYRSHYSIEKAARRMVEAFN